MIQFAALSASIRRHKLFVTIEREIKTKIFPHIKGRADNGYPFSSSNELHRARLKASMELWSLLRELDSTGLKMPENECNAFLYIAYRDLTERVKTYREFAQAGAEYHVPTPHCAAEIAA